MGNIQNNFRQIDSFYFMSLLFSFVFFHKIMKKSMPSCWNLTFKSCISLVPCFNSWTLERKRKLTEEPGHNIGFKANKFRKMPTLMAFLGFLIAFSGNIDVI